MKWDRPFAYLCYSGRYRFGFVEEFRSWLHEAGVSFWDYTDLMPGQNWHRECVTAIEHSFAFVYLHTGEFSTVLADEVEAAYLANKPIIPVLQDADYSTAPDKIKIFAPFDIKNPRQLCGFVRRLRELQDAADNKIVLSPHEIIAKPVFSTAYNYRQFRCDIFMMMPFRDELSAIYLDHIKPTIESMGLVVKRGDDFFSQHEIMTEIWSAIYNAKVIIADLTGKNPNVFYELGIAHTLGKTAIMTTQDINDVPFDVRGKRVIVYTPHKLEEFKAKLRSSLANVLE